MSPRERRGKWLFVILATLITLDKLAGVGLALSGDWYQVKWGQSVMFPLCVIVAVVSLRDGETWLRWLLGGALMFVSGVKLFMLGRLWFAVTSGPEPNAADFAWQFLGPPLGILGAHQLVYLLAGLALLVSPSLRAYFAHRRFVRRMREVMNRFVVTAVADAPAGVGGSEVEPLDPDRPN